MKSYKAVVAAGLAAALSAWAQSPTITTFSPETAQQNGPAFTLTVNGSNFGNGPGAGVRWNDTDLRTTFIAPFQLTAEVPAELLATAGAVTLRVTVPSALPGLPPIVGAPASRQFVVQAPAPPPTPPPGGGTGGGGTGGGSTTITTPTLTEVRPATAVLNAGDTTITVTGTNFVQRVITIAATTGSVVRFNNADLVTTFVNATTLTAVIPAALLTQNTTAQIRVLNSGPNGDLFSNALPFSVGNQSPIRASAPQLTFTGTASGTNPSAQSIQVTSEAGTPTRFFARSSVPWATVSPAEGLTPARVTVSVDIANLPAGAQQGQISLFSVNTVNIPVTLNLEPPVPAKLTATPAFLRFQARVGGPNPADQTVLIGNSGAGTIDFTSAEIVTGATIASAGSGPSAEALGSAPESGERFQSTAPTISSLDPAAVAVNAAAFTLTVNGTNYSPSVLTAPGTQIRFNDTDLQTTFVSATRVTANVPANLLTANGMALVRAVNRDATSAPVLFPVGTPPSVSVSASSLTFTQQLGNSAPGGQVLEITAASPTRFLIRTDGAPWVSVSATEGVTPARITVSVNPAGLAAGSRTAQLTVTSVNTVNVGVTYDITTPTGETGTDVPWLSYTPAFGRASAASPASIRVSVNARNLRQGSYNAAIRFRGPGVDPLEVPVTLYVAPAGPNMVLSQSGAQVEARQGQGVSVVRSFQVLNNGDGTISWSAEVLNGREWISVTPASGSASETSPSTVTLNLNTASLPVGTAYGLIRVNSTIPGVQQLFTVVANILAADAPPTATPTPSGLVFTVDQGPNTAPGQELRINVSSTQPISFRVAANTFSGGDWLRVTPDTGQTSTAAPGVVTVAPASGVGAALQPGVYRGELTVFTAATVAAQVRTVGVTLIVRRPGGPPVAKTQERHQATCAPAALVPTNTGLVGGFASAVGWPTPLVITLRDDCGGAVANGQVVAAFSNGDQPVSLRMTDPARGVYAGTWTPARATNAVTINFSAVAGPLPQAVLSTTGEIATSRTPRLEPNGTLNNFGPALGAPLAPGAVAQVYGSELSAAPVDANPREPLPRTLGGTQLLVGGLQAPIYYVRPGIVGVQIPYELPIDRQYPLVLISSNGISAPEVVSVSNVQPTPVTIQGGFPAAVKLDGSFVTPQNPAAPDEILLLFLASMGPTTPTVASGAPAPAAEPLARLAVPATVTIGGQTAELFYAGLAPGWVGLYQINLRVPASAATGELDLVIRQENVTAPVTKLPVRRP